MTLLEDIAECNKARWELARILLGERITGDIVERHKECIAEATRLVKLEFAYALRHHDWFYMMSDDPGVYKAGLERDEWIKDWAEQSDDLKKLYVEAKKRAGARASPESPS
jgi:hypothetical protein